MRGPRARRSIPPRHAIVKGSTSTSTGRRSPSISPTGGADNDREVAVTDTEIRAHLAERWSRSQPKEAALDYMADGIWEERREDVLEDRGSIHR